AFLKGRGLMQGVDVGTGELASEICGLCFEKGLVIETSGNEDQVIKVLAPLTTPMETLRTGLAILREATSEVMASGTKIAAE
ncbi:MAG: diaminobutyrate--2-oxoglutarate transaminase, partial [Rhodobacteraceae bacterium]|nr:diaminobutyrate--2-oxoglutarate transaminase [Paracoccaceae bacterium]